MPPGQGGCAAECHPPIGDEARPASGNTSAGNARQQKEMCGVPQKTGDTVIRAFSGLCGGLSARERKSRQSSGCSGGLGDSGAAEMDCIHECQTTTAALTEISMQASRHCAFGKPYTSLNAEWFVSIMCCCVLQICLLCSILKVDTRTRRLCKDPGGVQRLAILLKNGRKPLARPPPGEGGGLATP